MLILGQEDRCTGQTLLGKSPRRTPLDCCSKEPPGCLVTKEPTVTAPDCVEGGGGECGEGSYTEFSAVEEEAIFQQC